MLAALDEAEKTIGRIIDLAFDKRDGEEPVALACARVRYGEGGLWLRYWINRESD
jgi:hypothetical protein